MKVIRVLIANAHPVTRKGIRDILESTPDIEVVGEAKDGAEAKQMAEDLHPDVLLLDPVMPGLRPFEVEKLILTNHPGTVTLVLTAHDQDYYLAKAIEAGVAGFLTTREDEGVLPEAIRRAAQGETLITQEQLRRVDHWREEAGKQWDSLTEREREILQLLAVGQTTQQIAEDLVISEIR